MAYKTEALCLLYLNEVLAPMASGTKRNTVNEGHGFGGYVPFSGLHARDPLIKEASIK